MVEEIITIMIMALALGMDAFSIAIGMGMVGLQIKQMIRIGVTVGIFHIIMPLLGIIFGKILSNYFGHYAILLGGALLLMIGFQMVYSSFQHNEGEGHWLKPVGIGLILFSFSVSLDSFSAGLSLGMLGAKTFLTLASFGMMSMILSWTGLLMGSKLQQYIGSYGQCLGGLILIGFGVKLIF